MEEDTLSSEGTCGFCGEKVSRRALARHLKKHLSEKAAKSPEAGKKTFHLLVTGEGWYVTGRVYFLHLLVGGEASFSDLDDFLRAMEGTVYSVRAISRISKNSSASPSWMSL